MKKMLRHLIRLAVVCMLTAIMAIGVFAGDDVNPAPQTASDATLKNLPKDRTEAGKVIFEKNIDALGVGKICLKIRTPKSASITG